MPLPDRLTRAAARAVLCLAAAAPAAGWAGDGAATGGGPAVSVSSARLALMQLAAGSPGQVTDNAVLDRADQRAVYLTAGRATLADLDAATDQTDPEAIAERGGAYVARLPIVVLQGARLELGPKTRLALAPESFLVSLGRVALDHATVIGRPARDGRRAFLAGSGAESLQVSGSYLAGLGYGDSALTGGLHLGGRGLLGGGTPAAFSGNTLADLHAVTFRGLDGLAVRHNTLRGTGGIAFRDTDGLRLEDNDITGATGAYALRLAGTGGAAIRGNTIVSGAHHGLRIDDGARALEISGNRIGRLGGTALSIGEGAGCILLRGNRIADNRGPGITATGTGTVIAAGNTIRGNAGPGIALSRQAPGAASLLLDNTLAGNRSGIRGTGLAGLRLAGNDMAGQRPRLLSGDLDQFTPQLLRAAQGGGSAGLVIDGVRLGTPAARRRDLVERAFQTCSGETEAPA